MAMRNDKAIDSEVLFDMQKTPVRQKWYLRPVTWAVSFPVIWSHKNRIKRVNTKELKQPYILLCNHNAFMDFMVTTAAIFPHRANYVVAIDGFIGREGLLRNVGCICKRKFTNDITLVRQLNRVLKNGDIAVVYPEARYSLCGTSAPLPDSLGKMIKLFKAPVATLIMHGHHINSPFWNLTDRKVKNTEADFSLLYSAEELEEASVDDINDKIRKAFTYDEYSWQKDNKIRVSYPKRAEGLQKILYKCPACGKEYRMATKDSTLFCSECGKSWTLSEYGELSADSGETEFSHIPDWYEWEKHEVRKEIERGEYRFESEVRIDSLPNAKGYINLGKGTLVHDIEGFKLTGTGLDGKPFEFKRSAASLYCCHIEYDYLGKYGDCVDLNSLTETYYIYPAGNDFSVTKLSLATEELYDYLLGDKIKAKQYKYTSATKN